MKSNHKYLEFVGGAHDTLNKGILLAGALFSILRVSSMIGSLRVRRAMRRRK